MANLPPDVRSPRAVGRQAGKPRGSRLAVHLAPLNVCPARPDTDGLDERNGQMRLRLMGNTPIPRPAPGAERVHHRQAAHPFRDCVLRRMNGVSLGVFRCSRHHPNFAHESPIRHQVLAFPRTSVWIEHDGSPAFVADPGLATIYNLGQPYIRRAISPLGDHTDWLGLSDTMARDVVRSINPRAAEREQLFPFQHLNIESHEYLEQRRIFALAEAGADDATLEERTINLVGAILSRGYRSGANVAETSGARRRLVDDARALILESLGESLPASKLADVLGVSVFHLCRCFRAATGLTMQEYRTAMRLRCALHEAPARSGRLSGLAVDLGFYSHSHFTYAFRRAFGMSPSRLLERESGEISALHHRAEDVRRLGQA